MPPLVYFPCALHGSRTRSDKGLGINIGLTFQDQKSTYILETLRLRFFDISCKLWMSRSHVTRALSSGLWFEFRVCTAKSCSRGKWFTSRFFCTLRHHNPTFEKKYDFIDLFCLLIIKFYLKQHNFEDNISAKIEVSGWMKTNMAAASYHPQILSPTYGQMDNVKLLTANRSWSFAVKWLRSLFSKLSFVSSP